MRQLLILELEQAWGNPNRRNSSTCVHGTIDDVADPVEDVSRRIGSDAEFCFAFLRHDGLRACRHIQTVDYENELAERDTRCTCHTRSFWSRGSAGRPRSP